MTGLRMCRLDCTVHDSTRQNFKKMEPGLKHVYRRAWVPACFISCLPHAQELLPYDLQGVRAEFVIGWKV